MGTIIFHVLLLHGRLALPLRPSGVLVCKMNFRDPGAGGILLKKVFPESSLGFIEIYVCDGRKGLETGASIMPHFFFFSFLGKIQTKTFCLKLAHQNIANAVWYNAPV